MSKILLISFFVALLLNSHCYAGFLDNILKEVGLFSEQGLDETTAISGLKEALSIGTEKAVNEVSQIDGYLGNQTIKILMPEKIQKAANVLKKVGYQKQVDDFITSMNRAAEKAAPKAASHFVEAIRQMNFDDARGILKGSNTSATDYFRSKTSEGLFNDFKPVISSSMDEVGVARLYKDMMGKYTSLPFMKELSFDLDRYITDEALAGLFHMVAEEEIKIRTDPAARVTDLLKKVFTK